MTSMKAFYKVRGGQPVSGRIKSLGAKNFATKAMIASLLSKEKTILHNVPNIGDIDITAAMLESVGVRLTTLSDGVVELDSSDLTSSNVVTPGSGSNRMPILLISVLLHRLGEAVVPFSAGCQIGPRPVDYHIEALNKFGASVETTPDGYIARVKGQLQSCHYELPFPSVGATETSLFLGVLAKGTSIIKNVAVEPEIVSLITMLNSMGARIHLDTNRTMTIYGVDELCGTSFKIICDRIEAASWASLAAATGGEITVEGIEPEHLVNFLGVFNDVGGGFKLQSPGTITFFRKKTLKSTMLETDVYPGFSTDWQQPFAVLLTQAEGISIIHETVYENRFGYLNALEQLGAKIQLETKCLGSLKCRFKGNDHFHSAIIQGPTTLISQETLLNVPDLRAGLAYVIAAALAKGETYIQGIDLIRRGYGCLVDRSKDLDIQLEKVTL